MKFSPEEIYETVGMIAYEKLDIRTVTLGLSLWDCSDPDIKACGRKIGEKMRRKAEKLRSTALDIEAQYGLPIVNTRISLTPLAMVVPTREPEAFLDIAVAIDEAARDVGVNFVGGFSALVHKGETDVDKALIASLPKVLSTTERLCSSVSVASLRTGINIDACHMMGRILKE
ncbi:DUF711 family protein, partial [bacterium]